MDNSVGEKRGRQDYDFRPAKKILTENRRPENALAEAVKSGQRVSSGWKEAWKLWVSAQRNPNGVNRPPPNDPYRWPTERLEQFFEEIGSFFVGGGRPEPPPFQGRPFPGGPFRGGPPRGPPSFSDFPSDNFREPYEHSPAPFRPPSASGGISHDWGPPRRGGYNPGGFGFGGRPPAAGRRGFPAPVLVEFIKTGQRKQEGFRDIWKSFCENHGQGTMDPSKHQTPYFIGFIMYYGVQKLSDEEWAQQFLPELGNIGAPILVSMIKKGQRESEEWKEKWSKFCDGSGARKDPALHEARSLFEFVSDAGVALLGEKELMIKLSEAFEL